jgi:hypothetical protein
MSTWTPTARQALDRYLEKNRVTLMMAGGDADEVVGDLLRHVESEISALGLATVTEQDIHRILSRIGPVCMDSPSAPVPTPAAKVPWIATSLLFLFGILLPAATLGIELATHMCATTFFDPLPTWFHVFLVALVPVSNLLIWVKRDETSPQVARWIWLSNGVAFGISFFYTLLFLPISPLGAIAIILMGLGLLPLSPFLSMICVLVLRRRAQKQFDAKGLTLPRYWFAAAFGTLSLLALLAIPAPLTRHWIEMAGSGSDSDSKHAIKMLRLFGSEDVLLKQCYGKVDQFWGLERRGGDFQLAQETFYRVTGKPFNAVPPPLSRYQRGGVDVFEEFDWDNGLGGETVAGQVKGLSMSASRIDGLCKPEQGVAYMEWILEFRNDHANSQREARAQIQLPPGAVVSRLTLWVNGEEREAAFAGRGEVREAYQKIAVQERRDPVLVTTSGPDRVLMQCFPVQPRGGTMKVRLGITAPLSLEKDREALRLPHFIERNFRIPESVEHSLWLESSQPISAGNKKLLVNASEGGKAGIRGTITEQELLSADSVLWFKIAPETKPIYAVDQNTPDKLIVKQTVESSPAKAPARIAIVLDGSKNMTEFFPKIARTLDGMPSTPEVSIWLARDGLEKIFDSTQPNANVPSSIIAPLQGVGGQDNIPGLLTAWEWAAAKPDSVVLWIHGAQPITLSSIESLKQRTDWRATAGGPTILDVAVEAGPNRISERLSTVSSLRGIVRLGTIEEDLERLFSLWSHRSEEFHFIRTIATRDGKSGTPSANGSSHLVRLWAAGEIQRLANAHKVTEAVQLAGIHHLVTSVSGAVVLETKKQFEQAGLTPVDPALVPTVTPEPSTWALLIIGSIIFLLRGRMTQVLAKRRGSQR